MGKPHKEIFIPKNPQKYMGRKIIELRSSWESDLARVLDLHQSVVGWASESVSIPYKNPLTGRWTMYIPDFLVIYDDKNNVRRTQILEVKPADETPGFKGKVSKLKQGRQIINAAKWQAALDFCRSRNWEFRVCTEKEMYAFRKPR